MHFNIHDVRDAEIALFSIGNNEEIQKPNEEFWIVTQRLHCSVTLAIKNYFDDLLLLFFFRKKSPEIPILLPYKKGICVGTSDRRQQTMTQQQKRRQGRRWKGTG